MTGEEREKCSYLFHVFTGETIEAHRWNDKAATALYKMIREIKHCSLGISMLPSIPATPPSNPAHYLIQYVYDVVKKYDQLNSSETSVVTPCKDVGVKQWAWEIKRIVMGIGVD